MRTLVWIRRDVRVGDHTALYNAARRSSRGVVCLFVCSPAEWRAHDDSPVKVDLWLRSLSEMGKALERLNIPLLVRTAHRGADVPGLVVVAARGVQADAVFACHEYEVNERRRDEETARQCEAAGVRFEMFHDHVVLPPERVRTQQGRPYSVFTPFKKSWIAEVERLGGVAPLPSPPAQSAIQGVTSERVPTASELGFVSSVGPGVWSPGEAEAKRRLTAFVREKIGRYKEDRDPPALDGTSVLSPYLAVGAISPRACVAAAAEANSGKLVSASEGPTHWISEVVWREFYRHIVVHFPRVCMGRAFKPETEKIVWADNPGHLEAWKQGRTGFPIVDAGMRQLASTGWMHNRVRMIVAMFLSKDLFLNWREGERHFMLNLADGDLAQNNGGWQWSASTGTDAAPYFRIYNPINQSQTHDPEGRYIKKWVPELEGVAGEEVHDPSGLPMLIRHRIDYPAPIVDRGRTRDRVMKAFAAL